MGPLDRTLFRRVDHIGVIVADLDEQKRWLGEIFGLPVTRELNFPETRLKAAFYGCGGVDIEMIQVDDPVVRQKRLGEGNRARIEHIAVEVDDIPAVLKKLAALGVRTTEPEPRKIGDRLNVWTVAETTGGVSYQLIQRT
ncbi:MAG TPA: VOC family protein [bacterium]|nr:VOC family protein [bacterium]